MSSQLHELALFQNETANGSNQKLDEDGMSDDDEKIAKARQNLNSISKKITKLETRHQNDGVYNGTDGPKGQQYYTGYPKHIPNPSVSAVIPLKFNAKLDGIGGITIGNLFKVDPTRLPKGYKAADIGFIVMGEQQQITAGQDWTTDMTGQLVLLDLEKKEEEIIETIDDIPELPPIEIEILEPDNTRVDIPNLIPPPIILIPPPGETREFVFTDVNFDTDKSILKPEAKASLDKFAEYMLAHPNYTVDISGHTDSDGSAEYNQGLSERRALAVKYYFINESGIDPLRLESRGMGEIDPIDTNDTPEGKANNRRTVFLVHDPDGDVPMNVEFTL